MHHLSYFWEEELLVPMGRRLGESQSQSGSCGEAQNQLLLLECLGPDFIKSVNAV
jgi:hypothetical protein